MATPNWRDTILQEFTPGVARLTLVADPDGLFLEEGLLKGIEERGFDLILFEDHVAFRYAYESRYRTRWDGGEMRSLVVVLRAAPADLRSLPFDLLQVGRRLSFSLADLFPNLSLHVIQALERSELDSLYDTQAREHVDRPLGENQTCSFILRHVFKVAPETIKDDTDLLKFLLERHYRGFKIPRILDDYLIATLNANSTFTEWPIDMLVPDREGFFTFLQERWPIFLDRVASASGAMHEYGTTYGLEIPGPENLPFEHPDIRVYIGSLFLEGLLDPISHPRAEAISATWAAIGLRIDVDADRRRRWSGLVETVEKSVPSPAATHQEWQSFAPKWAQLIALRHGLATNLFPEDLSRFEDLRERIDCAFFGWARERFGTLYNQPALPPVMVHHVPRLLARYLEQARDSKAALLVMDGLSLDQWIIIEEVLRKQRPTFRVREDTVFAWIPTLTMVCRQACFAGRPPLYFPTSIHTTDKEPKAWMRFWQDEGFAPSEVGYEKNIRDLPDLDRVDRLTVHPKLRAAGLVVDKIDRIMHGMELGTAGMHNQVRQWAEQGTLAVLLDMLLDRGFSVFLTADHGNIEARGCGRPFEGSLAELRSQRARVFNDASLRTRVHERFPAAIEWPPIGLPDSYLALLAPHREAFVGKDERLVAHGGITVEEVIVPLIEIERK